MIYPSGTSSPPASLPELIRERTRTRYDAPRLMIYPLNQPLPSTDPASCTSVAATVKTWADPPHRPLAAWQAGPTVSRVASGACTGHLPASRVCQRPSGQGCILRGSKRHATTSQNKLKCQPPGPHSRPDSHYELWGRTQKSNRSFTLN